MTEPACSLCDGSGVFGTMVTPQGTPLALPCSCATTFRRPLDPTSPVLLRALARHLEGFEGQTAAAAFEARQVAIHVLRMLAVAPKG